MNQIDLQQLAAARLRKAEVLLNAGEWSGAYYLAGYAVECGLKACIAKMTGLHDFPDKNRTNTSYSHKVSDLLSVANLKTQRDADSAANQLLRDHWYTVERWDETARYVQWSRAEADQLFQAITDPTDGVLAWIKGHW